GLLEVDTVLGPTKELRVESAVHLATGTPISGYRMHMGVTSGPDCARPFARIGQSDEGARSDDGLVCGTYMHGAFAGDEFRHAVLNKPSSVRYDASIEAAIDGLAHHLARHVNLEGLLGLAREVS
ncbi:MAG: cobyric acid synthase CobQ, partial [Devosia sp.]